MLGPRRRFTPALAKALVRPQNLLLLVALPIGWYMAATDTVSEWALIPGALLMYLLGVVLDIGATHAEPPLPVEEPRLPDEIGGVYQGQAAPAFRVRDRVQTYLDGADATTRRLLQSLVPQFDSLVGGVCRLAAKSQQIDRFLARESVPELERQLEQSEERAQSAADAQIRGYLQESGAAINERLATYKDLLLARDRIDTQIESVVDGMEAMYARIVRISVADAARARDERQPVTDRINALLAAIEETDRHVAQIASIKPDTQ